MRTFSDTVKLPRGWLASRKNRGASKKFKWLRLHRP